MLGKAVQLRLAITVNKMCSCTKHITCAHKMHKNTIPVATQFKKSKLLRYTWFTLGLFQSKSIVVGSCLYNGKDEHL